MELRRITPDFLKRLPPQVPAHNRKLHARKHFRIRSDVARGMPSGTRIPIQNVVSWRRRRGAVSRDIANERFVVKHFWQRLAQHAQPQHRPVAVHLRRHRGVNRVVHSQFLRQLLRALVVCEIVSHQNVRDRYLQSLRLQEADSANRLRQRPRQPRNAVVNLRAVRVNTDLDLFHSQPSQFARFPFANHHRVRFDLNVEKQLPRVSHQLQKITSQKNFPSAKSQKEGSCRRQLIEDALDFPGRHLPMILMIEITMPAALVAAVSDVHMNAQRHSVHQRLVVHLMQQAHRLPGSPDRSLDGTGATVPNGSSETSKIPWAASSRTNWFASAEASSEVTLNCGQTSRVTISSSGVTPSAACQITLATSFKVKKVESRTDITIVSAPSARAAMAVLRAM